MKYLICEQNLAGFFTAVYQYYYLYKDACGITSNPDKTTLLDTAIEIPADTALAAKVRSGIIKKTGQTVYKEIIDTYLSCHADKEQYVFDYIRLLLDKGMITRQMYGNDIVMRFNTILKNVRHEAHRMTGFIRLQEMGNGIFYGHFATDNDVIELVMKDMLPRFNSQQFILHDIKREKLIFYDGNICHKFLAPDDVEITLSENESGFQQLWKRYFTSVSIEGRKNPRLQQQFLPKKYRFFMHEF